MAAGTVARLGTTLVLLEIALRTLILYFWTFGLFRLLGQRAVGQLSVVELLLVVALGSAVGDPMFYPDVPLLHGMTVVAVVVGSIRAIGWIADRSRRAENWLEGHPVAVVRDAVMDREAMDRASYPPDRLFEELRLHGVEQLGQVRAAYLEQNGRLSVFRVPPRAERPGLAVEPPPALAGDFRERLADEDGWLACGGCGRACRTQPGGLPGRCTCGAHEWTRAALPRSEHGTTDEREPGRV